MHALSAGNESDKFFLLLRLIFIHHHQVRDHVPFEQSVSEVLAPGMKATSSGIVSSPGMVMAPKPDEWPLLDDEEHDDTEMMECGRLAPFFRCSTDDTAIELRERGTETHNTMMASRDSRLNRGEPNSGQFPFH